MQHPSLSAFTFLFARSMEREELAHDCVIRDLDTYWTGLREDGRIPHRAAIDPTKMPPRLLPWLFLMDVLRDGDELDYRYRLAGTSNVELVGRDPTGQLASEIFAAEERAFIMDTFHITVRQAKPTFWRAGVPHDERDFTQIMRGLFPLAGDDGAVSALICAAVPDRP